MDLDSRDDEELVGSRTLVYKKNGNKGLNPNEMIRQAIDRDMWIPLCIT